MWLSEQRPAGRPPAAPGRRASTSAPDDLVLVALAGMAGAVALVGVVGELASWAASGRGSGTSLAEVPGVVVRLPFTLADPARAWPDEARPLLPGPVGWWLWFLVVATTVLLAAISARRAMAPRRHGGARWAAGRHLRSLSLSRLRGRSAPVGRLVIGRVDRRLVATEARHSLLVVGPTQTGKTTGLAVPAILAWRGPVVATSVKGDLLVDTVGWRRTQGDVWIYDPAESSRYPGDTWSPLAECATWRGALRTASSLADVTESLSGRGGEHNRFFYRAAAKLLAPYLFAAAVDGKTVADVVRWVDGQDRTEARAVLARAGNAAAAMAHRATAGREDRTRSNIYTTAEEVLEAWADPVVAASAASSTIEPARLLDGSSNTLYVTSPPKDQQQLRPLFAHLVGLLTSAVYAEVARTGRPLSPPLLVVLDEAANIAPVPDLAVLASTAASHGVQLVTVWQDLAQLSARYGAEAPTVLNNHRAKLVLGGVGDKQTLDYASLLAGDAEVETASTTLDSAGRRSRTMATRSRPLVAPHELRQLPTGRGVLLYGNLAPAEVRLRPWYRSRRLKGRARTPDPLAPPPLTEDRKHPPKSRGAGGTDVEAAAEAPGATGSAASPARTAGGRP